MFGIVPGVYWVLRSARQRQLGVDVIAVLAVDGPVESGTAVLDESALTGEPLPVEHATAGAGRSGTVNAGAAFDLRANTSAAESTYAGVVRLVEQAHASSAPFVRMADRFAGWFLLMSLTLAGAALERLAGGTVLLLDKTGTLTEGRPTVAEIVTAGSVTTDVLLAAEVRRVHRFLTEDLLPHEEAEDRALYPAVAAVLGGTDPNGAMSRAHVEIGHHVRRLGRLLDQLPPEGPDEEDLMEMRRLPYGLHESRGASASTGRAASRAVMRLGVVGGQLAHEQFDREPLAPGAVPRPVREVEGR